MALDSKQKRGSVIGLGLSFRTWLVEPSGAIDQATERVSLLRLASTIEPSQAVPVEGWDQGNRPSVWVSAKSRIVGFVQGSRTSVWSNS